MEKHTIEIVVTKDGTITGTVKGVTGSKCGPLSEWLNRLGKLAEHETTEDFYKPDEQSTDLGVGA